MRFPFFFFFLEQCKNKRSGGACSFRLFLRYCHLPFFQQLLGFNLLSGNTGSHVDPHGVVIFVTLAAILFTCMVSRWKHFWGLLHASSSCIISLQQNVVWKGVVLMCKFEIMASERHCSANKSRAKSFLVNNVRVTYEYIWKWEQVVGT